MEKVLYALYKLITETNLGKVILGKTEFEVNRYLPFDDYGIGVRTVYVFGSHIVKSIILGLVSIIFFAKYDFKYIVVILIVSISCYYDSLAGWKRKYEMLFLRQLSSFVSELRHSYFRVEDVEEAFSEVFDLAGEELKLHLGLIEEAFEYGGIPERYKVAIPSKFLLVLLSICQCTIKYGDKDMVFISNLDELQKNIDSDLLKWDRENFLLKSLFLVIVIPILCLPMMERWAISQMSELHNIYNGYVGSLVRIAILLLSFPVFLFFFKMKDTSNFGVNPLLSYVRELPIMNKIIKKILGSETRKGKTADIFRRFFPQISYVNFILFRIFCFIFSLIIIMTWIYFWKFSPIYHGFGFIFAFAISFLPYLFLVIRGLYYESEIEDEIGQVRLILISLSGVSGITTYEILLWIESFTTYLKDSISECIDDFNSDEEAALNNLRKQWKNTGFISIVDDLIASDKIGIQEAFKDLHSRREYYIARRRQEQEFITRKKEGILNTFMYFPFMVSVFLYLIIPFLYLSFNNLLEITRSLK